MRAVVTGAAGFIGRHFVRELNRRGWEVVGCDVKGWTDPLDGLEYGPWDCRDLFSSWARRGPAVDLLVHAAAIVGGRETIDGQPLKVATDLAIDSDAFQYAVTAGVGRVLYFSSSAAYPIRYQSAPTIGVHEDDYGETVVRYLLHEADLDLRNVSEPDQSYGWTKVTGEKLAALARAEGVPVTVVRPFSGYGTDQDLTYPFPSFVARARAVLEAGARTFDVWGDGRQVRDFIHVDDVVGACFAIMESGTEDPVNLCTGRPTSFDELAELMLDAVDAPRGVDRVEIVHHPDKPAGVQYRVGDPERMLTYYKPTVTLEDGIRRALRGEV